MATEMEHRIVSGEIVILEDIYGCEHYFSVADLEAAGWAWARPSIARAGVDVNVLLPEESRG